MRARILARTSANSPDLFTHRSAKIDFRVQILGSNSFEEFREIEFLAWDRFDDNAAGSLTHVHGILQTEFRGLEDGGGDSHRGAVTPFLDDGLHCGYRLLVETLYQHGAMAEGTGQAC